MIDLAALTALRAVAASGSVAGAAASLGFTPSAVSQQLKRLERRTGVPLLERVGRGVVLTRHGRHLVEEGGRLLAELERLETGLHQQAEAVAGQLRLTAFSTAVRGLVAPVLGGVLARHPDLTVTVHECEPWDTVDLVATGRADLGVVHRWGDVPLRVPDHLAVADVGQDVADVVLHRDHSLAARDELTPSDLVEESWVATPVSTICRQWLHRMFDGTGRLPRVVHESWEFDCHLALARARLAVALVPRLGRQPIGDELVAVPVTDPVPSRAILGVHRRSMAASPAVTAVLDALAAGAAGAAGVSGPAAPR